MNFTNFDMKFSLINTILLCHHYPWLRSFTFSNIFSSLERSSPREVAWAVICFIVFRIFSMVTFHGESTTII